MNAFRILLTVLLLAHVPGYAIIYNGKVMCKETGKPVAFANVGVVGGNIGTTTNEQGAFSLPLDDVKDDEVVRITSIGFAPFDIKAGDLKAQYPAGKPIMMQEQQRELKEVTVRPHKVRHARLGNTTRSKLAVIGFDSIAYGKEVGVLMHPKRIPAYIDSVRINVSDCNFDTVFLRLNVYEQVGDSFINILREPIFITMSAAQAEKDNIHIDLTRYNIAVRQNFMISLEYVKDLGARKRMHFCAALFSHNCYARTTSQGKWKYEPLAGPAFSTYVTY